MVEGQLYDWLMRHGHTSEENAHDLAGLTQRSGIQVPRHMRRNGKLVNFFLDRSNIFGIVRGTDEAQNPSIYARDFRQEYRGRPARGRGGLQTYVNRRDAARDAAEVDDMLEEAIMYRATGGKSKSKSKSKSRSAKKSKSRSRSARKSRSRKNRNRRSKSKSRN
jgi:hypothetical protein